MNLKISYAKWRLFLVNLNLLTTSMSRFDQMIFFQPCVIGDNATAERLDVEVFEVRSYTPGLNYVISHGSSMYVHFTSSLQDWEQGFSLSYKQVETGKHYPHYQLVTNRNKTW